MTAGETAVLPFPAPGISAASADIAGRSEGAQADLAFFGPALDLRLPEPLIAGSAAGALIRGFSRPVLASALVSGLPPNLPLPPAISFRAAATANMIYRALPCGDGANGIDGGSCSFEWQIGELHWLPSVKSKKRGV